MIIIKVIILVITKIILVIKDFVIQNVLHLHSKCNAIALHLHFVCVLNAFCLYQY